MGSYCDWVECQNCEGLGYLRKTENLDTCPECEGQGEIEKENQYEAFYRAREDWPDGPNRY